MFTQSDRQHWMATLAKAPVAQLQHCFDQMIANCSTALPSYRVLRPAEVGLAMVRGRAGGTGQLFNLGEITVTRCVVQITTSDPRSPQTVTGFGYVSGRSPQHARLAAVCDALMQLPTWRDRVRATVIAPLATEAQQREEAQQRQSAATQVNFFTMPRES